VPDDSATESTTIPSAAAILDPHYPSINTGIPDQYRVDYYLPQFQRQVAGNSVPNLTIIWLPGDHTSGYTTGLPVPTGALADNDLARGRILEVISNSSVWAQVRGLPSAKEGRGALPILVHLPGPQPPVW
jgi:hypothetical protein